MAQKIRIIVADDQEIFRKSLVTFLEKNFEFQIVADAATGKELLELLKQKETDIVFLDSEITALDAKTTMKIIHQRFSQTKIIILSQQPNTQLHSDYMELGANSFLGKKCDVKTLFEAIHKVKTEGYFFEGSNLKAMLENILKDKHKPGIYSETYLNDKETEILKEICDGKTNKEIAVKLYVSASTIDFHRTKLYNKTNCHNVASLIKYALKNGLVAF